MGQRLSTEQLQRLVEVFRRTRNQTRAAEAAGCSHACARVNLIRLGEMEPVSSTKGRKRSFDYSRAEALILTGLSRLEAAKRLGVSEKAIEYALISNRTPKPKSKPGPRRRLGKRQQARVEQFSHRVEGMLLGGSSL